MPNHKRVGSSLLHHPRRSRRIARLLSNDGVTAHHDDESSSADGVDKDGSRDNDDDEYRFEGDNKSQSGDDEQINALEKDIEEGEDSNDDEDNKRVVTIIPHEALRHLGGVEYEDYKVHMNTLLYPRDLMANNARTWFKSREKEFIRASKDWESFVATLMPKIMAFDSTIPELLPKDVIFRVYQVVRFRKDQRPYKSHFPAPFSRTGRRRPYACYYIQLGPGSSYVGGGLWAPEPATIHLLRESIDERPEAWRQLLNSETFRDTFLSQATVGVEGALKAFVGVNKKRALKTKLKGYDRDHRDIQLLKLRNYHVTKTVDDAIFMAEDGQKIINIISILHPFVRNPWVRVRVRLIRSLGETIVIVAALAQIFPSHINKTCRQASR
ncbi:hypothetical protein B0J13DRAFT_433469 [Dactylonectria estremocensis]|uniref:Uncharacterized protein n=1 Tax=Dactylonectria estremocensis TaxID=1079267 RepID=A0A9P9FD20_9HYPO|nr:hypothetical protein B0J13DRAFT_433469 [Dactylonectria estremocensis]